MLWDSGEGARFFAEDESSGDGGILRNDGGWGEP